MNNNKILKLIKLVDKYCNLYNDKADELLEITYPIFCELVDENNIDENNISEAKKLYDLIPDAVIKSYFITYLRSVNKSFDKINGN